MPSPEVEVETLAGVVVKFSLFDPPSPDSHPKLFIHGDMISGEWPINNVGVVVHRTPAGVKVEFWPIREGGIYQSWYFKAWEFKALLNFFRALGFKCEQPDPMGIEESKDERTPENRG